VNYNSEAFFDSIVLSYKKILIKFEQLDIKTKNNKSVTDNDLRRAISIMIKKHPTCRWKSSKLKNNKNYILAEGYLWLINVYFQKEKTLMEADIEFFLKRIKEYKQILNISEDKKWWNHNMTINELEKYFMRDKSTIRKAIKKMCDIGNGKYKYYREGQVIVSSLGIEWLTRNIFKHKYLELLEEYKMDLTERFIKAGYFYDNYFYKN